MRMTNTTSDEAVREYLRAVDRRLGGLPLLQRRELINDLESHIAAVRAERGANSEGEVLEILERLGSPEVVAAAAYAEAGPQSSFPLPPVQPMPPVAPRRSRSWVPAVIIAAVLTMALFLAGVAALVFLARAEPSEAPAVPVPPPVVPSDPAPTPTPPPTPPR